MVPGACLMRALGGVFGSGESKRDAGARRDEVLWCFRGRGMGIWLRAAWACSPGREGDGRGAGKRTPGVAPGVEVQGRSQRRRGGLHGAADRN